MRGVLLDPQTGRPEREHSRAALFEAVDRIPAHVLDSLDKARSPESVALRMSRQYFADLLADPPSADLTAVTATTETGLWSVPMFTPIGAGDARAGKIYKVTAGGIVSTGASGTLTITPRYGTTTGGVTLGASNAQTVTVSVTNVPWYMEFVLVFRQVGTAASSSTCVGTGYFSMQGTTATAGGGMDVVFGGTVATTADTTTAQGIFIGWTLSVAGSVTPRYAFIQSLN